MAVVFPGSTFTIYPCLKKAIARMMSGARYAAMPTSTMKAICRRILRNSFGVTLRFPLHHHQRATEISGVAARKSMAAPMQNRSHGHNLASSTISSRVILNFPLLYFTEVLLLGAIKGLKQKALTVGAVQGLCFLSSERLYSWLLTQVHVCISHNCRSILRRLTRPGWMRVLPWVALSLP